MTKNNQPQKIFVIHQRQQNKKVFTGKIIIKNSVSKFHQQLVASCAEAAKYPS